jgi:LmbE family N-acetylglucosaminyl deacetylase
VDITSTIETKVTALKKHASQLGEWDPQEMIRSWAKEEGKKKRIKYAEAFKVMINEEEKPEN